MSRLSDWFSKAGDGALHVLHMCLQPEDFDSPEEHRDRKLFQIDAMGLDPRVAEECRKAVISNHLEMNSGI